MLRVSSNCSVSLIFGRYSPVQTCWYKAAHCLHIYIILHLNNKHNFNCTFCITCTGITWNKRRRKCCKTRETCYINLPQPGFSSHHSNSCSVALKAHLEIHLDLKNNLQTPKHKLLTFPINCYLLFWC